MGENSKIKKVSSMEAASLNIGTQIREPCKDKSKLYSNKNKNSFEDMLQDEIRKLRDNEVS